MAARMPTPVECIILLLIVVAFLGFANLAWFVVNTETTGMQMNTAMRGSEIQIAYLEGKQCMLNTMATGDNSFCDTSDKKYNLSGTMGNYTGTYTPQISCMFG